MYNYIVRTKRASGHMHNTKARDTAKFSQLSFRHIQTIQHFVLFSPTIQNEESNVRTTNKTHFFNFAQPKKQQFFKRKHSSRKRNDFEVLQPFGSGSDSTRKEGWVIFWMLFDQTAPFHASSLFFATFHDWRTIFSTEWSQLDTGRIVLAPDWYGPKAS